MNRIIDYFLRGVDAISEWSGKIVSFAILLMVAFMVLQVITRYLLNKPFIWILETTIFTFGIYVAILGVYALHHRRHVKMDLLYSRWSPRAQAIVDIATSVFFFLFYVTIIWKGWEYFYESWQFNETTMTSWRPVVYPIKLFIPVSAFLITLTGIAKFIRDVRCALSHIKGQE
jgi:TRAP-type mannitol/chloroaromatic compound transport system permease small subunit